MKNLKKQSTTNKDAKKIVKGGRHKKTTYLKTRPEPMLPIDSQVLTISPQGQITIPKAWREMLEFSPGRKILALIEKSKLGKTLSLRVEPKSWVDEMAGISSGTWGSTKKIDDYVKRIRSEWDK